jgi:hypothetical protein
MTTPTHILLTLPLDRIALGHLVAGGVVKAEALVDHLSPALLAATCDAVAELRAHDPAQLREHFVTYLAAAGVVTVVSPAPAPAPLFDNPLAPRTNEGGPDANKAAPRRRRTVSVET